MNRNALIRRVEPLAVGGAAVLLLAALALPAAAKDVQTRGGGARVQLSPGTTSTATATVSPSGGSSSAGSAGSSSSSTGGHSGYRGGHHGYQGYHGGHHHRRHSYYYRPYLYLGYGHYPYYFGYYGYGYYHGPYSYGRYYTSDRWGSLDLDVRPEKAEVYVNGQRVGVADNYDGFPEYLWLKQGTYNLVFYHEGYRTLTRKVTVLPGIELDFQDRLEPGDAVRPEELADGWMEPPPEALAEKSERSDSEERWRDRARRYLAQRDDEGAPTRDQDRDRDRSADTLDARGEPARLVLNLQPADASVYLDGRFLGTAEELSRLHAGLLVDPGEHLLEVVHPNFRTERRTVNVEAGDELEVGFQLAGN